MSNFLKNLFDKKKGERVDVTRRFELLARVGQGSMSKVWRARDSMTGRMLAVKVLDKVKTERFEHRFVGLKKPSEGEIAASLQHPNIVRTIEFGTTKDDEQYLVMEFVEGLSLSYLVDTQNEQMRENCLNYVIQLGEAIEYLHRQNWIHRDLCPRNVMVDPDNVVKLIDFGLVVPNTADFQRPGNRTGTANYMAPELIKRQRTDQRIDIFSFSVTAFEMYAKRLPWDVADQETLETVLQHINKPPKPISDFAPHVDPRVADVIMKGLRTNPDERWQTMAEMLIPLRKAHEEIEAKKQLQRRIKAAAAKGKTKQTGGAAPPRIAKQVDDDFFEQVLLDEGITPRNEPKPKSPARALEKNRPAAGSSSTKSQSAARNVAGSKSATSVSDVSKLRKSSPVPEAAPSESVEDEFEGIEIEEEGHKLESTEQEADSTDEFDGIEIEVEGDLPVKAEPHAGSENPRRTLKAMLDNDVSGSVGAKASASAADEDDEPVLRLPDDD